LDVAILGTGAIGLGLAALLHKGGHRPVLWSRAAARAFADRRLIVAAGAIAAEFAPCVATDCAVLADTPVVVLAVPGNAHQVVIDQCVPYLRAEHTVIISSHCSFSALYLAMRLARRGIRIPVVALGTTVLTGRLSGPGSVKVANLRQQIDIATLPTSMTSHGVATCRQIFGDRFLARADLLAISLSNLNPQNHLAMALCNFTRIERGEAWGNYDGITSSVGRLIEALDAERLAVAAHFGVAVRTVREHFHLSFDTPLGPVAEMAAHIHARGNAPLGPTTTQTRYVLEDVPYGLVPTEWIAHLAGVRTPLHSAGIELFSAMYGQEFRAENRILPQLGLDAMTAATLRTLCRDGWPTS
jgi:opine dehydrogenase